MNHRFHKVIFSQSQQQFVVVSELAKSAGKSSTMPKVKVDDLFSLLFENLFGNKDPTNLNDHQEVRTITPNLQLPNNRIYRLNSTPNSTVLVETDPDFTNEKRWLSSDYMFNALRVEPNQAQKRLGDGFYEQRLVREQINRLTGRQFLGNYTDFDSQYRALMNAGVTFAEKFNLRVGIALSPEQVANLTSDIVWLESESVTLPNGKVEQVLVPKVYALAQKGDITGKGALLSGNQVTHRSGELINSGTIAGRELVQLDSQNVKNSGTISGGAILGNITGDLANLGGTLEADRAILLNVGGNLTHSSTLHTTEVNNNGYQRSETTIGRKGLIHVKGEDGVLQLQSGGNFTVSGADIINDGQGQTYLSANGTLALNALQTGFDEKMGGGEHYRNQAIQDVNVSHIKGNGDVILRGGNIYSEGADIDAKARLALLAENDIVLGTATRQTAFEEYHKTKSGSAVAKKTQSRYDQVNETLHKGTELTGDSILIQAGNDIQGESLLAVSRSGDIDFIAGNNVTLNSATNLLSEQHINETKRSGFLNGGELGVTIGSQKTRQENTLEGAIQSTARNTLASEEGNVRIQAGNKASVSNMDIIISNANTAIISGKNGVQVEAGKDVINSTDKFGFSQSGLTIALSTPVTDAIQSAQQSVHKVKTTQNEKLKAVYAMKAAEEAVIAAQNAQKVAETLGNLGDTLTENYAAAENPEVKISVSVGSKKQERESKTTTVTHAKSQLNGGNILLISDNGQVVLEGVDIKAKDTLMLDGKEGIISKGVADTYQNNTTEKSSSAGVGAFIGFNGDSYGIGLEASGSVGKGKENSYTQTWQNNQLQASKLVTNSAKTLTLDSTNVKADYWKADVKNLELISRQDITKYNSEQVQAGGSVSVTYGSGGGANVNAAYNSAKLNTAQVENQTSINIGKGGMDVKVQNNTHLDGAIITSEADKENNRFQTGTLTTSDIENHSELKTRSAAISGGTSGVNPMSALSLLGNKNESEQSTTRAAIGENIAINLTQDPNAESTLNNLNRDTQNANQKVTKHDIHQVQETQELIKGIGEISDKAFQIYTHSEREVLEKAKLELGKVETRLKNEGKTKEEIAQNVEYQRLTLDLNDKQQAYDKKFGTGSDIKRGVDAVTAALQGLAAKDAGQAVVGLASPYLNEQIKLHTLNTDGSVNTEANLIAHALLGAVEAATTGNNVLAGATAGAGSEAAAKVITEILYKGRTTDQLTEAEKQNVVFLSQLAGGLASGIIGDSTQSAAVGADIGKRAVENNYLSHRDVYVYQKALKKAIENGESVEEVHKYFKALSEKQRDELLADCDIDCRITVPQTLLGAVNLADDLSGALNSWLQGLPFEEQGKFYQLVESENQKTIEALKEKQTGLEKGIELAMDASRLFAKESDINTPKTKQSLYDSKKAREKLEKEFGKENVISTTIAASGIRNTNLAGKKHPKTGVPFDSKGYPIFDDIAKYDTRLDIKSFRSATYPEQMEMATKQLYKDLGEDGLKKLFNQKQINAIKNGDKKIPGFTWHHHQDTGRMQLVPEWQHSKTGHIGGDYIQKGK